MRMHAVLSREELVLERKSMRLSLARRECRWATRGRLMLDYNESFLHKARCLRRGGTGIKRMQRERLA
eukprot:6177858-Pleurochrysis_carterae.AAC.3